MKMLQSLMPYSVSFNMLLFIRYLSASETLIFGREMRLIGSTSLGFAKKKQYMIFKVPY